MTNSPDPTPAVTQGEIEAPYGYARRLAEALYEKHYKADTPNWQPLPGLIGVLTQIDNMTAELVRAALSAAAKEREGKRICGACGAPWRDEMSCGQKDNGHPFPTCYATRATPPVSRREQTHRAVEMIAALFVETNGVYFGLPNVDPWDRARDARTYVGPHPVVAHPPCKRWGRYATGAPCKPNQYEVGADEGCFKAALASVRRFGGVLEHPEASKAWGHFNLNAPPRSGGWVPADMLGGWTCCVYQGHYGHMAGKATWLYAHSLPLPELRWGQCEQRLHPVALAKHGYEKARRIGMMAMVGGKDKERVRDATPIEFRDALIAMADRTGR